MRNAIKGLIRKLYTNNDIMCKPRHLFKIFNYGSLSVVENNRKNIGLPEWNKVENWLIESEKASWPISPQDVEIEIKNTEIKSLKSYSDIPDESFWENFPFRDLPSAVETRIDVKKFEDLVESVESKMSKSEKIRAGRTIKDLKEGASSYQKSPLPPIRTKNAESAFMHGAVLTDTIATWVKKGFVAGPFECPPMAGFRGNPLAVVVKNGKARPILNMSGPVGKSFNDNVDKSKQERLHMGTAKKFSFALRNAGQGAIFSKFDLRDAYKLIPVKKEDQRLQGFEWLGKFFVETQLTFGSSGSACNFDKMANTKDVIVCIRSKTPRSSVLRALDDSPCVAPNTSKITERFSEEMKIVCDLLKIPLAENCEKAEKAFENQTRGTVLGTGFDSTNMTWFLSNPKANKLVGRCLEAEGKTHIDLKQTRQLMGSINDFSQLCPLTRFFKRSGNCLLTSFENNENILKIVPENLKKDVNLIAKVADTARTGLPIAEKISKPPLAALTFYTDAAGASFSMHNGKKVFHKNANRGLACIAGDSLRDIWAWTRLTWPDGLITGLEDERGKSFGCKSTTLEAVGILIPLLVFPDKVSGNHIVVKIDNIAVVFGWESGYVKNDESASEILKAAFLISGYLGTVVHVEHVGRMSDKLASLTDELSRKEYSDSATASQALLRACFRPVCSKLMRWLENPGKSQNLSKILLDEIKETYKM